MNYHSKDAPLQESIAKMKAVPADIPCETRFSHERHPLEYCYSVNITSTEAPGHIYANGKGIESAASMASGLGEYIERLQTNNFFSDFYLPQHSHYPDQRSFEFNHGYLNAELRLLYDPEGQLSPDDLLDYNSDSEDKIIALPFINQTTDETIYFPINILSNLYVSNGLASGNTPLEAQVQALSEILERYAKIEIIKKGLALPKIPDERLMAFSKLQGDILTLREQGYIIEVLDASLGGQLPVTAISLINPLHSTLFVSFGAHPILEVALERTMTELMQGRGLDDLDTFDVPTFDMDFVADSFNLESHFIDSSGKIGLPFLSSQKSYGYTPWDYQGEGCQDEHRYLTGIISEMDREIYLREYNYLGFYSCHILIPQVSEIYPIDDLIYNNRNRGKGIRQLVLHFEAYHPKEILAAVHDLDDSLQLDQYIGVIFKQPFTMLEFKAQMHLLIGNKEAALETLTFSEEKMALVIVELIRLEQEQRLWQDYEEALFNIFGQQTVARARQILENKAFLIDTTLHHDYDKMLKLYARLGDKKQNGIFTAVD